MLFEPSTWPTPHYPVTMTLSQSLLLLGHTPHTMSLAAASPVTRQPKDSPLCYKLCRTWAQEFSPSAGHALYRCERTPSLSADRSLSRREMAPLPSARCLAVGWLRCHLLAVSPWDGSLTIRLLSHHGMAPLPSAHCLAVERPHRPLLLTCCVSIGDSLTIRSPSPCEADPRRETSCG